MTFSKRQNIITTNPLITCEKWKCLQKFAIYCYLFKNMETLNVLELFSGIGGMHFALKGDYKRS